MSAQQHDYDFDKQTAADDGYLDHLPLSGDSSKEAETASALRTLFGEGGGDVHTLAAHEDEHQNHEHQGRIEMLAESGAPGDAVSEEPTSIDNLPIDTSLTEPPPPSTSHSLSHSNLPKRKASSRANMLARGGACDFCKNRKLKCSAESSGCTNCVKANRECVYSQKRQRSRVKVLEDRLQELERMLRPGSEVSPVLASAQAGSSLSHELVQSVQDHDHSHELHDPSLDIPVNQTYHENLSLATFEFDLAESERDGAKNQEPDLMTLAHAAAADINTNTNTDAHAR